MDEYTAEQATNHYYFVESILGNLHNIKGLIDIEKLLNV